MLSITPEIIESAYEFLRTTLPFRRWKLPPADDIEFRVVRDPTIYGSYIEESSHIIAISDRLVGHTTTLLATLAHEMIHLYQAIRGTGGKNQHGVEFRKFAAQVCKAHGFDPKAF